LIFIALDYRNTANFGQLFSLLLSQLAYKQIGLNIAEYLLPIFKVKPKIRLLEEEFKE